MSGARAIEHEAAGWLSRAADPAWSDRDQAALDTWLQQSDAHRAAYWRLEYGSRQADRVAAMGLFRPIPPIETPAIRRYWIPVALAASLIMIIGLSVTTAYWRMSAQGTSLAFDTPVGGRETVPLPDGSKVELNTATRVHARVTATKREIWLDRGEAYFEVAHRQDLPFVVHAGSRTVTVLGTKFGVRRDGDKVTVSVVEGRVRVDDGTSAQSDRATIITAGDTAIGLRQATLIAPRSKEKVEGALSWRTGTLTFDQTPLADAVNEFNRYRTKPIIITDQAARDIPIGGSFPATDADAFVRLLRDAYGLKVANAPDAVRISS